MEKIDILQLCDEQWSNDACLGYVSIACDALNYSAEQKQKLLSAIDAAFGNYTVLRAKEKYYNI